MPGLTTTPQPPRLGRPLRWADSMGDKMVERVEKRMGEQKKKAKPHRIHEYPQLESYKKYTSSGRMRLERFERAFRYLFENSDTRLGCYQKRLVDVITIALLPKLFGSDLVHNLKYLQKRYSIEELNDTVAIIFPRRSGKTEGAAIVIAALAVSQPKGNSIMYNLTATQAKEFLQSVIKHLNVFKDSDEFGWTEKRRDLNRFIVIETQYGESSVKSYPSALKGDAKIGSRLMNRGYTKGRERRTV